MALVVLLLAALAFVPALDGVGIRLAELPSRPLDALGVLLILAQTLPLLARTRWPAQVLAAVGAAWAVSQAMAYPASLATWGVLIALYSVGAHLRRRRAVVVLLSLTGYAVTGVILHLRGASLPTFLFVALLLAAGWGLGGFVTEWRARESARRRLAVATAQARAARARVADLVAEQDDNELARTALAELDRLLDELDRN
ncbi:hypothetical protein [Actinoplanes sp. NPDC049265]|uniref:hypothetical protein n=1 Tax=Actinoplanes sp. NPDC049265 TaxID=3363902 RepID=UPI003721FB8D